MTRPLRLELAGGLYHVTSRGDGREDIYLDDTDREVWLTVFAQVCARFKWVCHAWKNKRTPSAPGRSRQKIGGVSPLPGKA